MIWKIVILSLSFLAIAGCDDDESPEAMLGGGSGGSEPSTSSAPSQVDGGIPAGYTPGQPLPPTMASEFGYVDNPAIGGSGDPGTTGNWYTGSSGNYIGGMNSVGVSLPASTEIALYGSISAAQGQSVQVIDNDTNRRITTIIADVGPGLKSQLAGYGLDVLYGSARQLGMPINGSAHVQVIPLTNSSFK